MQILESISNKKPLALGAAVYAFAKKFCSAGPHGLTVQHEIRVALLVSDFV